MSVDADDGVCRKGELLFKARCVQCHTFAVGAPNKNGVLVVLGVWYSRKK